MRIAARLVAPAISRSFRCRNFRSNTYVLKSPTEMKKHPFGAQSKPLRAHRLSVLIALLVLCLSATGVSQAQQHISKHYPAGKNLRLELKNITGEITVESWDRNEI